MHRFRKAAKKVVLSNQVDKLNEEKEAIQAVLDRSKEVNREKDEEIKQLNEEIVRLNEALYKAQSETEAAVKIQSAWRGHEIRKEIDDGQPVTVVHSKKKKRKRSKSVQKEHQDLEKQLQTQLDQNKKLSDQIIKMTKTMDRQTKDLHRKTAQFKKEKTQNSKQNDEVTTICEELRSKVDKLKSDNRMYQRDIYELTQKTDSLRESLALSEQNCEEIQMNLSSHADGQQNDEQNMEMGVDVRVTDERLQEYVKSYQRQIQQLNEHAMRWKNHALRLEDRLNLLERECENDIGKLNALLVKTDKRNRIQNRGARMVPPIQIQSSSHVVRSKKKKKMNKKPTRFSF